MILIDGKKIAAELREELKVEVSELKSKYNNFKINQKNYQKINKNLNNIKIQMNIKSGLNQKLNYQILDPQDKVKIQQQIHKLEVLIFICLLNYFKFKMDKDKVNLIQNYQIYFLQELHF